MSRGHTVLGLVLGLLAWSFARATETQTPPTPGPAPTLVVVVGAPGEGHYGAEFARWADAWRDLGQRAGATLHEIGRESSAAATDLERLEGLLRELASAEGETLWLVLLGHGTYDGRDARFNLRGPDFSAADLARWLGDSRRPLVVVNCSAASAPFIDALSGPQRVVVTATRSGYEQSFARFGQYLVEAFGDPEADLDKDDQVSLLEAFLAAARNTASFYATAGRLATEHALLDDNGDRQGTPADWFQGLRLVKQPPAGRESDGTGAHRIHLVRSESERWLSPETRARRNALEWEIEQLRRRKPELSEDAYYDQLERLLVRLARAYAGERPDPSDPQGQTAPDDERTSGDRGP